MAAPDFSSTMLSLLNQSSNKFDQYVDHDKYQATFGQAVQTANAFDSNRRANVDQNLRIQQFEAQKELEKILFPLQKQKIELGVKSLELGVKNAQLQGQVQNLALQDANDSAALKATSQATITRAAGILHNLSAEDFVNGNAEKVLSDARPTMTGSDFDKLQDMVNLSKNQAEVKRLSSDQEVLQKSNEAFKLSAAAEDLQARKYLMSKGLLTPAQYDATLTPELYQTYLTMSRREREAAQTTLSNLGAQPNAKTKYDRTGNAESVIVDNTPPRTSGSTTVSPNAVLSGLEDEAQALRKQLNTPVESWKQPPAGASTPDEAKKRLADLETQIEAVRRGEALDTQAAPNPGLNSSAIDEFNSLFDTFK